MDTLTLYKKDSKGKIRVWSIYAEQRILETEGAGPNRVVADIITNAGLLDGKLVKTVIPVLEGKNRGRSNATSPYEQACAEAESTFTLKVKEGYVPRIDMLQESQTMGSGLKEPMLAQKFHPTGKQSSSKTLDQLKLRGKKIGVQRKKDGNRVYVVIPAGAAEASQIEFRNRKTESYGYTFPDLAQEIYSSYRIMYGAAGHDQPVILDGEFYTNEVSFNKLNGILKAKTLKLGYKEILDSCKIHVFDLVAQESYKERHDYISRYASGRMHIEEYYIIEATEANLLTYLRQFQSEGEEGLMIRTLDAPYQHKRTWDLMKYKDDQTEDYIITGMEESAHPGQVGAVIMRAPEGTVDRDGKAIISFKAGTTGLSHEESKEMWQDFLNDCKQPSAATHKYLGMVGVVRFFEKSEYNIPRFPKFIGIRAD